MSSSLFQQLTTWENLLLAYRKAAKGKRGHPPAARGIPWLGFIVYPTYRRLKRRNAVNFTRRLRRNISRYRQHTITFAELDASVGGWINHVRYADTWGLRRHIFGQHPISRRP